MFLRILTLFLSLGPVPRFVKKIPSVAVFSTFAQHFTTNDKEVYAHNCTLTWAIFDTGTLKVLIVVVLFPAYIWIIYSLLRNCIPRILIRLWIGIFIFLLGAGSMLLIDVIGHVSDYYRHHEGLACIFFFKNPEIFYNGSWNALGSAVSAKYIAGNCSIANHVLYTRVYLSSKSSLYERLPCWVLLCNQRSVSVHQLNYLVSFPLP